MRKSRLLIIILSALSATTVFSRENEPAEMTPPTAQPKIVIAVLDLETQGIDVQAGMPLSDLLRSNLVNTNRFSVMERGKMDEILKEQGFQQSGACTDEACIVEMGQLLGVENMVGGSIGKLGKLFLINLRVINIRTGKIEQTVSQDCKCEIENLPLAIGIVADKLAGLDITTSLAELKKIESETKTEKSQTKQTAATVEPKKPLTAGSIITAVLLLGAAGGTAAYFLTSGEDKPSDNNNPPPSTSGEQLPNPPIPAR